MHIGSPPAYRWGANRVVVEEAGVEEVVVEDGNNHGNNLESHVDVDLHMSCDNLPFQNYRPNN